MLDAALRFFQEELNTYIKIKTGGQSENVVHFPEIQLPRDMVMQSNAITLMLVNLEEERRFRTGSSPSSFAEKKSTERGTLSINFHLLFVANFKDYLDSLKELSLILKFFRSYRIFTQEQFPRLSGDIQRLSTELVNLTFMEQGELWRSLEMPSSPSALYKIRLLNFSDSDMDAIEPSAELSAIETSMAQH